METKVEKDKDEVNRKRRVFKKNRDGLTSPLGAY